MKSKPLIAILFFALIFAGSVTFAYFYWDKNATASPQVAHQTSNEKTTWDRLTTNFQSPQQVTNASEKFTTTYGAALNGATVWQYVKGLYDAANKGNKEAAFNIYRAETICARIPEQQQMLREMSATTDSAFVASVRTQIKDAEAVCVDFNSSLKERLENNRNRARRHSVDCAIG
jgi:hypothetical protein